MSKARVQSLSFSLQELAGFINTYLQAKSGEATPFVLVIHSDGVSQYISNAQRDQGKALIETLLARWQAGRADIPAHMNPDLWVDDLNDPEVPVTRSLLAAACAELRKYAIPAGADDQVVLNLEASIGILRSAGGEHVLYTDADKDRPEVICDRNGRVVLGMCKQCGRAESQLEEPCSTDEAPAADFLFTPGEKTAFRADLVARWPEPARAEMTGKLYAHPAPAVERGAAAGLQGEAVAWRWAPAFIADGRPGLRSDWQDMPRDLPEPGPGQVEYAYSAPLEDHQLNATPAVERGVAEEREAFEAALLRRICGDPVGGVGLKVDERKDEQRNLQSFHTGGVLQPGEVPVIVSKGYSSTLRVGEKPSEACARLFFEKRHAERQEWIDQGKCPDCHGEGVIGGQFCGGTYEPCEACNGSGKPATKEG